MKDGVDPCVVARVRRPELVDRNVTDHQLGALRARPRGGPMANESNDDDIVPGLEQALGRRAADKAGAASDKDSHFLASLCCSSAR